MPRIANDTAALLADVQRRLERLVEIAKKEGRDEALGEVRQLVAGGGARRAGTKRRGRPKKKVAKKPAKRRKKRKSWWDTATARQRAERIRKMQAGRGLKPKRKRKPAKAKRRKATKKTSSRKSAKR